jgi:GcrA cell cycle regulator
MRMTKCGIIGRAHRLKLPPRGNPVKRSDKPKVPKVSRPAPAFGTDKNGALPVGAGLKILSAKVTLPAALRSDQKPTAQVVQFQPAASRPCCWPIGTPREEGFRFCDAPGVPNRPYCPEHMGIAYLRQRVENAA